MRLKPAFLKEELEHLLDGLFVIDYEHRRLAARFSVKHVVAVEQIFFTRQRPPICTAGI